MGIKAMMRMNKRGMDFKNIMVFTVLAGLVIVAWGVIIFNWTSYYGFGIDNELETIKVLSNITEYASEQQDKFLEGSGSDEDTEGSIFKLAFGIVGTIFAPVLILHALISDISILLEVPVYITISLGAILVISVITGIVAIVFRLGRRNI